MTWTPDPEYYDDNLKAAWVYQDYIARRLCRRGIALVMHQSRQAQIDYGENMAGIELKYDRRLIETDNLWIETAEKPQTGRDVLLASGIYSPHCWLYGIGNEREFWLFSVRTLRQYIEGRKYLIRATNKDSGEGFILPRHLACKLAELHFRFPANEEEVVKQWRSGMNVKSCPPAAATPPGA